METFQPPKQLNFESDNLANEWKKWENHLKVFLTATEKDGKPDNIKTSILLACIGDKGREIYETFQFGTRETEGAPEPSMVYKDVVEKFRDYCNPRKNITILRYKFFTCKQLESQTFDDFVTRLKVLSQDCEFGDLRDSLIKDVILIGVLDDKLRERLMREATLDLNKAIQLGQAASETRKHAAELKSNLLIDQVKNDRQNDGRNRNKNMVTNCRFCKLNHPRGKCSAFGRECMKCHEMNHYARCCPNDENKSSNTNYSRQNTTFQNALDNKRHAQVSAVKNSDGENDQFIIDTVNIKKSNIINTVESKECIVDNGCDDETCINEWLVNIQTNNFDVQYKIDSGAQCNVMPMNIFKRLYKEGKLLPSDATLSAYSDTKLNVYGRCVLSLLHRGKVFKVLFYVVETQQTPLLGLNTSTRLDLIRRVDNVVTASDIKSRVLKDYSDVFGEMGTLKRTYHMVMKDDAIPVIAPTRRLPFGLVKRVDEEIDRMVKLGVVEKIPENEPTEWLNTLVVVEKPNGKVRLCLDPRHLNKAIKREHFQLPTVESIMAKMQGARYFSKLDASSGYWQIKVDDETAKRLAFMTTRGRYRFTRLPFGIHSASEVFQSEVAQIISGIDGVDNSQDDIIIWGNSKVEHENRLMQVLSRIRESGMKLNLSKCIFGQKEVTFLGHILSAEGVKPDPEKTRAIKEMPLPRNKVELQRFLGMINYLGKFLPNLATVTTPLRELLQKDNVFVMEKPQIQAVSRLKEMVMSDAVLKFYDPMLKTRLRSDASNEGLGAMLEQEHGDQWHPVAYASRSLNSSERNYAPIEAEALSVVFACEKFREYLYGRSFVVLNDHKPLESIFKKPITSCPPRIQRFFLRLQRYDFTIQYNPGATMKVSDALSRAALKSSNSEIPEGDMKFYVHAVVNSIPVSDRKWSQLKIETEKDEMLMLLRSYVENGWPRLIDPKLSAYSSI